MSQKIQRNDPCPCGSGKKFKKCCLGKHAVAPTYSWMDEEGVHVAAPGTPPSPEQLEQLTKAYQQQIRHSPLWHEMVRTYGKKHAEELLKQCQAKLG